MMSVRDFFNKTAVVQRKDHVADEYGTWTTTYIAIYSNLPCCVQPMSGFESVVRDKLQSELSHHMYCDVVEMQPEWRVVVEGKVYDILDVRNPGLQDRFLVLDLKQIVA